METIRELISVSFLSVSTVWFVMLYHFSIESPLTIGRTFSHTPTVVQGGGGGVDRIPLGFWYAAILPSVESLWSSLQEEIYFMDGGAAEGLWRHQTWSPSWPPSWILSRIRNRVKTVWINNFLRLTCKITHKQLLCIVSSTSFTFEKSWKNMHFHSKMAWHLLLMTSYLITIVTDRH